MALPSQGINAGSGVASGGSKLCRVPPAMQPPPLIPGLGYKVEL